MITEEQFKEQCAEILRNNITFAGQVGGYVIHGALDALWKLHTEQKLNKPDALPPDIERVLVVVAKRWGNDYPGSTVGIIGNEAKDILEKHNVDWRQ